MRKNNSEGLFGWQSSAENKLLDAVETNYFINKIILLLRSLATVDHKLGSQFQVCQVSPKMSFPVDRAWHMLLLSSLKREQ
uniref:Uncharacterized protein n=1 Tax=Arion vulgaris TaxID=1028688 RepID=A0A0B7BGL4_9EUPU